MSDVTIYHNPRCSKSRQTLALLNEKGVDPKVVEYLNDPPDSNTLKSLVIKLGLAASDLVRQKEFRELDVLEPTSEEGWIQLMADNPRIIERPIVVADGKAVLGRPPQRVLEIL